MLISTGCARQAYRSNVTNDPLVSHQVVAGCTLAPLSELNTLRAGMPQECYMHVEHATPKTKIFRFWLILKKRGSTRHGRIMVS